MRRQYPFHLIEPKWQQHWEREQTFKAFNPGDAIPVEHPFAKRHGEDAMNVAHVAGRKAPPKFYILDMFPYPSGAGLHVGHPEGYTATDILARYRRAKGFNVLHPMGWDSFGLPAEQYAVKTGQHPRVTTEANIANFTRQIRSLGFSYDWSREVATTDPGYYRWTQWIFLQLYNSWFNPATNKAEPISTLKYPEELQLPDEKVGRGSPSAPGVENAERRARSDAPYPTATDPELEAKRRDYRDSKRLAYVCEAPVNWCPELGTVLANEEVIDGKSEVGGFPVVRKPMRQWMLRITAYAERLLADLDTIDWSDSLKEMQRNWIGRSEGAEVDFAIAECGMRSAESEGRIRVFTTRPDTLFGATYMVLSPEHKLVDQIVPADWPESVAPAWIRGASSVSDTTAGINTARARADHFGSEIVQLADREVDPGVVALIPGDLARRWRVIPVQVHSEGAVVALEDPSNLDLMDQVCHFLKRPVQYVVAPGNDIDGALHRYYRPSPKEAIASYRAYADGKSDLERTELAKEKTGVFTGAYAINPVNGEKIPIWIADYVLASYGTGAIMAVPAHDERDFEFAKKFNLPIKEVVAAVCDRRSNIDFTGGHRPPLQAAFCAEGIAINSPLFEGLPTAEAKAKITAWLEEKGLGKKTINYKLRDWLFSRQRYWGEPFPIVWKKDGPGGQPYHEALPESALPVLPPTLEDYKPTSDGQPPLARAKDWLTLPDGSTRETNTMPQWAGSCWYYLRYLDAKNGRTFVGREAESYWMGAVGRVSPSAPVGRPPILTRSDSSDAVRSSDGRLGEAGPTPGVDLYVGGTEHAVLHLLYARFWHKVLFDLATSRPPSRSSSSSTRASSSARTARRCRSRAATR